MLKQFFIENELRAFVPLKTFRAQQQLPDHFGMALFQPKDYTHLGSLDRAGSAMQQLHQTVLAAFPDDIPTQGWTAFTFELQRVFRHALLGANPQIGLHPSEIDYAVAGFSEVCQVYLYALRAAQMQGKPLPAFLEVYAQWLYRSLEVSQKVFTYEHQGGIWHIQLIRHIYGRIGFKITHGEAVDYVYDPMLACPAEGFMVALLSEVAARLHSAFTGEQAQH